MLFWIDFNREDNREKEFLNIGAVEDEGYYCIDLVTLEDLENLEKKIKKVFGIDYSMIVGFDNPTIFIDKDV